MRRRSYSSRLLAPVAALATLVMVVSASPDDAAAGGTKIAHVDDFDEFDDGEAEGVAIEGSGRLTVGYVPQRGAVDAEARVAFTCAASGKDMYIGTADAATIQRVSLAKGKLGKAAKKKSASRDKDGEQSKTDKRTKKERKEAADEGKKASELQSEVVAKLPGVVVSALVELQNGDLLAATLPGGVIHRVTPKGQVSEFAKLDVKQIWAIVPHKGRILVATGPKGELFSLSSSGGDPKVILDVEEKDLLSVLVQDDSIVVGTSPGAKLFQVTSDLDGVLLHDFKGDEVRALAFTEGGMIAAVNNFTEGGLSSLEALTKNLNRTSLIGQPPEGSAQSAQRSVKAGGVLYHVDLKGQVKGKKGKRDLARAGEASWETWLTKDKQYFTDVAVLGDREEVLVSSSYEGKIYRVRGRRDLATVADFDERKATSLCRLRDGSVLATTGDGAAVYRLDDTRSQKARYKSKIFDAGQPATYGALLLRGDGEYTVRARVGPSDEPDKRWTDWMPITLVKAADGRRGLLNTPQRRYLQLQFDLVGADAEIRDFELFYAPENLAPQVTSVELDRPSFDVDDDDEPESKVTIKWKAKASDGDDLVYEVRVRPEGGGDGDWVALHGDVPVTKKELKWDLDSVPDGLYEVEVMASDEPANGVSKAQTDAQLSPAFVVDRSRPELTELKVKGDILTGAAKDNGGYIHDVAVSVDGKAFRPASAGDGLFDGNYEAFTFDLPGDLDKGRHRLVVRARDAYGNIGSSALFVDR
jgi:hypothetical protein